MQVTIQVPDEIASRLGEAGDVPRCLLEALAADAYRCGTLTRHEIGSLLGLDYWQTDEFLTVRGARRSYTLEDLAIDRRSLGGLGAR